MVNMEKLIDKINLWTERVIPTQMYKDNKELFINYLNMILT